MTEDQIYELRKQFAAAMDQISKLKEDLRSQAKAWRMNMEDQREYYEQRLRSVMPIK